MEADRDIVLDQHDPVEDPAPHIARALEAVEPAPDDHDGILPRLQPGRQVRRLAFAQDCLGDGRLRHQRGLHLDEGGLRRLGQRLCRGARITKRCEGCVDLPYVQRQPSQRAVALQCHPVGGRRRIGVHLEGRTGAGLLGCKAPQPHRPGCLQPGAHDGVVDHHHRHGRARDDVEVMRGTARLRLGHQVDADIALRQRVNLGLGNADQHDRLGMLQ